MLFEAIISRNLNFLYHFLRSDNAETFEKKLWKKKKKQRYFERTAWH